MSETNAAKYIYEPSVQRAALRFALKGGSPQEYLAAMDKQAREVFNAQIKSVRASNRSTKQQQSPTP
jgi:hypothetical protein